jgi:hypothetical protein
MLKVETHFLNIFANEFSFGIYTLNGEDDRGYFRSINIGLVIFEINIFNYTKS